MLALFAFPGAAQHVATCSTLEVAQVTKSVIPAHRLHGGAAVWGGTADYFGQLVTEQVLKVGAIHICVQQLIIAYFALGQGFSGQHASTHTAHVFTIPVLF
jgi:hypothetical protein